MEYDAALLSFILNNQDPVEESSKLDQLVILYSMHGYSPKQKDPPGQHYFKAATLARPLIHGVLSLESWALGLEHRAQVISFNHWPRIKTPAREAIPTYGVHSWAPTFKHLTNSCILLTSIYPSTYLSCFRCLDVADAGDVGVYAHHSMFWSLLLSIHLYPPTTIYLIAIQGSSTPEFWSATQTNIEIERDISYLTPHLTIIVICSIHFFWTSPVYTSSLHLLKLLTARAWLPLQLSISHIRII